MTDIDPGLERKLGILHEYIQAQSRSRLLGGFQAPVAPRRRRWVSLMSAAVGVAVVAAAVIAFATELHSRTAPRPQHDAITTAPATPSPILSWDALCQHDGQVSALMVTRSIDPANDVWFSIPARLAAINAAQAQALAAAVCSLRTTPSGVGYYCSADWGVAYQLQFSFLPAGDQSVDVDASGCSWAALPRGQGPVSWWTSAAVWPVHGPPSRWTSTAFWSDLGTALGIPHATQRTFSGTPLN